MMLSTVIEELKNVYEMRGDTELFIYDEDENGYGDMKNLFFIGDIVNTNLVWIRKGGSVCGCDI